MRTGARGTGGARLTRLPPMAMGCGTPARVGPSISHLKFPVPAISNRNSPELETMSNPYKTKAGDAL